MLHRLDIVFPASHRIVHASNDQHASKHQTRPVHVLRISRNGNREERSDSCHDDVHNRKGVDRNGELPKREAGGRQRLSAQALGHDAGNAESVAEARGAGEEGNDGVECCGRADVDQSDDH